MHCCPHANAMCCECHTWAKVTKGQLRLLHKVHQRWQETHRGYIIANTSWAQKPFAPLRPHSCPCANPTQAQAAKMAANAGDGANAQWGDIVDPACAYLSEHLVHKPVLIIVC